MYPQESEMQMNKQKITRQYDKARIESIHKVLCVPEKAISKSILEVF